MEPVPGRVSSDFAQAPTRPQKLASVVDWMGIEEKEAPAQQLPTIRGKLTPVRLLDLLALAASDNASRAIRLETERGNWCEMICHNQSICEVRSWGIGPDVVDLALKDGRIDSSIALRLRLDLLEKGERLAQRLLGRAGLDNDVIASLLEATARERTIAAGRMVEGTYSVTRGIRPRFVGLPIALPLIRMVAQLADQVYPLIKVVERYENRQHEVIRKNPRYAEIEWEITQDIPGKQALSNLADGETLASWIKLNHGDSDRCHLLLFKLEHCGAVTVGSGNPNLSALLESERNYKAMALEEVEDIPPLRLDAALPFSNTTNGSQGPEGLGAPRESSPKGRAKPDAALESLLHSYVTEEAPPRFEPISHADLAGRSVPKQISAQEKPELDELGDEACETWLRQVSPIIQQDLQKAPEELLRHLDQSTLPQAGTPIHLFILGLVAISQGKPEVARTHLKQALQGAPRDRWINTALALLQTGYYSRPTSDLSVEGVWKTVRNLATQKG